MNELSYIEKLKKKWNIKSNRDVLLILIVFSLAGMSIVYERRPIFHLLGIGPETPFWIKTLVYIPIVIPCYQLNLLIYGFLLGQFDFFFNKQKRMLQGLKKSYAFKKYKASNKSERL